MKRSTRFSTIPSGVRTVKRLPRYRQAFHRGLRLRGNQTIQREPCSLTGAFLKQGKNLRASALIVLVLGYPLRGLPVQPTNAPRPVGTLAALQARLQGHVTQPRFAAAQWGVKIVSLDSGKTLFDHNAGKLFKPASNAKLFTGALALDRLGPDYRIKTSFYAAAKPDPNGVLHGDLLVYGRGDPSFAARFNGGNYGKSLEPLVAALAGAAVRQVEGDLIGDDSHFRGPPFGSSWTWDDLQNDYGAEVSALTQEDNVVDLVFKAGPHIGAPCLIVTRPDTTFLTFINRTRTMDQGGKPQMTIYRPIGDNVVYVSGQLPPGTNHTDAVSVHTPALWFVTRLKETLERRGVTVVGKPRSVNWLDRETNPFDFAGLVEVASVESRPMSAIVGKMMKPSQNLYAQLLLLQVGARAAKPDDKNQTTEQAGIAELKRFAKEAGIRGGELLIDEGSGLSRSALVTPNAIVELLRFMSRHRCASLFRDALPIAGVDGSLRNRMKGTAAERNARAKTGTIAYVNTLSGYLTTAAGEPLAFSLMLNNYNSDSKQSGKDDIDVVAVMLAEFNGRSDGP
jgi:serine-type D-Ala-D-Ala carboxypeptidase/endopeptidase (penicillin-binding protein 4)